MFKHFRTRNFLCISYYALSITFSELFQEKKYKQKGHQLRTKENIKADKWDTPQISAYVFSSECKYPKGIYYQ